MDCVFICMIASAIIIFAIGIGRIIYNRKIGRVDWIEVVAQVYDYSSECNLIRKTRVPVYKYTYNGIVYFQESPEKF